MTTLMLGVFNKTTCTIDMGDPVRIVGEEVWPMDPAHVPPRGEGPGRSAGMFDSDGGNTIELEYHATVAHNVTLTIDIWIRGTKFEKFIVTSSDPANYPIEGKYEDEGGGNFKCAVTVGR